MQTTLTIVTLYTENLAEARRFYTEMLGFTAVPELTSPRFVTLGTRGAMLALQDAATLPPGVAGKPGGSEVGLLVDDVDGTCQAWQAKGVTIVIPPIDLPFGRSFVARDPEGHLLRVYRPAQAK